MRVKSKGEAREFMTAQKGLAWFSDSIVWRLQGILEVRCWYIYIYLHESVTSSSSKTSKEEGKNIIMKSSEALLS